MRFLEILPRKSKIIEKERNKANLFENDIEKEKIREIQGWKRKAKVQVTKEG